MWTLIGILLLVWLGGLLISQTVGGLLHLLVVLAVILALFQLVRGPRRR